MAGVHGGALYIVREPRVPGGGAAGKSASFSVYSLTERLGSIGPSDLQYDEKQRCYALAGSLADLLKKLDKAPVAEDIGRSQLYDQLAVATNPPGREAVLQLGRVMVDARTSANGTIPAAYTYLGQFIAHDISKMEQADPQSCTVNLRTAALDLDSLFWNDTGGHPQKAPAGTFTVGGVSVGSTGGETTRYDDLPRESDGKAHIPDERNDHNVAVAQVHVLLSKFHQTVAQVFRKRSADEQRRITLRHFQSIVLHDYLKLIIDPKVYDDVLSRGRAVVHPAGCPESFYLPLEFAAACFRFGHSMVRSSYPHWRRDAPEQTGNSGANVYDLAANTSPGGGLDESRRLKDDWRMRWQNLLDLGTGGPQDFHVASAIDTTLTAGFYPLKPWMLPKNDPMPGLSGTDRLNLAVRTLLRGHTLGLPSGEELCDFACAKLDKTRPALETLTPAGINAACSEPLARYLNDNALGQELAGRTPLWLYTLCEAKNHHGGQRLGALASRIVMETIHAAIQAAPGAIIDENQKVTFVPERNLHARSNTRYELRDMVACVADQWRSS